MSQKVPNLRTIMFSLTFYKTMYNADGNEIDMYLLHDTVSGEGIVSIGIPKGRIDIAKFILKSCIAGQRVLNECNINNIDDFKP